jgi:hypothetical protein
MGQRMLSLSPTGGAGSRLTHDACENGGRHRLALGE